MLGDVAITIRPVWATIEGPPAAIAAAAEVLTVPKPGAEYSPAFQRGHWDGQIRFLRQPGNKFLAGLSSRVHRALSAKGWNVHLANMAPVASPPTDVAQCLPGMTLRPYQVQAITTALQQRRLAIQSPTGSGKTHIALALIRLLHRPTLWVTHRRDLVWQTATEMRQRLDVVPGILGGGNKMVDAKVTIGTVQTLTGIEDKAFWRHWECLVLDEVHHAGAASWTAVTCRCINAAFRYGLSGTPRTKDAVRDMTLEGLTGPILVVAETMELADQGFLATPHIVLLRPSAASYPPPAGVRDLVVRGWREDPRRLRGHGMKLFQITYERGIVANTERNALIAVTAEHHTRCGEHVLVLVTRLDHGQRLLALLPGAAWLSGDDPEGVRAETLAAFRAGRLRCLIGSDILKEGIDLPEIDVLIQASGQQSEIATLQKIGRALRPRPDKAEVLIYDFLDGVGGRVRGNYLAQHSATRVRDYKAQGFQVTAVR